MRTHKKLMLSTLLLASLFTVACADKGVSTETDEPNKNINSTEQSERVSQKELDELVSSYATSTQTEKPTKEEIAKAIDKISEEKSDKLVSEGISKVEQEKIISQSKKARENLDTYNLEQLSKELDLPVTSKSGDSNPKKLSKILDSYVESLPIKDLKGTLSAKKFEKDFSGLYSDKPQGSGYIFLAERYGTTASYHFNKNKDGNIDEIFITYPAVDNKESAHKFLKETFGLVYTEKSKNLQTYYDLETGEVSSITFKGVPKNDTGRVVILTNTVPDDMYYTEEVIMRN